MQGKLRPDKANGWRAATATSLELMDYKKHLEEGQKIKSQSHRQVPQMVSTPCWLCP